MCLRHSDVCLKKIEPHYRSRLVSFCFGKTVVVQFSFASIPRKCWVHFRNRETQIVLVRTAELCGPQPLFFASLVPLTSPEKIVQSLLFENKDPEIALGGFCFRLGIPKPFIDEDIIPQEQISFVFRAVYPKHFGGFYICFPFASG